MDHRDEDSVPTNKVGVADVYRRKEADAEDLGAFWIPVSKVMICTSTWCIRYGLKSRYRLDTMFMPCLLHALFWNHGCRVSYRACVVGRETRQELTTEEV